MIFFLVRLSDYLRKYLQITIMFIYTIYTWEYIKSF